MDLVVAVGGDGTVHEVVNGLLSEPGPPPTLAHVAVGTGCDFARGLGISPASLPRDLAADELSEVAIDAGRVDFLDSGERRWFINACNVGLGPIVARRIARAGWRRAGRAAYMLAAGLTILAAPPVRLRARVDGHETIDRQTLNLSICNGRYFGGGMQPCPDASVYSRKLHLAWVGAMGRPAALARLPGLLAGRLRRHSALWVSGALEIVISGESEVEVDGEVPGRLPARFSIAPAVLKVLAPASRQQGGDTQD
jgi:YegS/Rv2252/BmrU family lipid kinase